MEKNLYVFTEENLDDFNTRIKKMGASCNEVLLRSINPNKAGEIEQLDRENNTKIAISMAILESD